MEHLPERAETRPGILRKERLCNERCISVSRYGVRTVGDYYILSVQCRELCELAEPGQFLHVRCGEKTLRRPISIHDVEGDEITMVYEVKGEGTRCSLSGRPAMYWIS